MATGRVDTGSFIVVLMLFAVLSCLSMSTF